ncbi:hypothetical protein [Streptodolium elevatio]|uniref:Stc1 domain-containing protein n=1 Tax=Streptodolium elevatio TaxID=3157996 RepID=A0ABV3DJX5_9ACTN
MPAATDTPDLKICDDCFDELPAASFKRHGSSADGLQARCIPCAEKRKPRAKKCKQCGLSKQLTAYPVNRLRDDGHGSWCTDCHNAEAHRTRRRLDEKRMQRLYEAGLLAAESAYSA